MCAITSLQPDEADGIVHQAMDMEYGRKTFTRLKPSNDGAVVSHSNTKTSCEALRISRRKPSMCGHADVVKQ
jgi:hypothetical protein